jgi:hypothetical protein
MDFWDFHPEQALGFLPHELDAVHLRMLWRRWKKKAGLRLFGRPITPLGPVWLDKAISAVLGLKGDFVADYRLIDYLVALLSTAASPALDGQVGNEQRLKRDLAQLGIFDESMSLYLLYKLRSFSSIGFSGFEGRQFSLFDSFVDDMGEAASLQALVTALAYRYLADGVVTHADIPDDPAIESERRQFVFAAATGVTSCNIGVQTSNRFMLRILARTQRTRASHRYAGYLRVRVPDYQQALLITLLEDAAGIIADMGMRGVVERLQMRLQEPRAGAAGKLTAGILHEAAAGSPMAVSGEEFNRSAEAYYQGPLRRRHLAEASDLMHAALQQVDAGANRMDDQYRHVAQGMLGRKSAAEFWNGVKDDLLHERADADTLRRCIALTLVVVSRSAQSAAMKDGLNACLA